MWRKAGRLDTAPCAQPGSLCAAQRKAGRQAGRPGSNVPPQRLHDLRQYEPLKMKSASAGGAGGQAGRQGGQASRQAGRHRHVGCPSIVLHPQRTRRIAVQQAGRVAGGCTQGSRVHSRQRA